VGSDWAQPLQYLIGKESSGNPTATNSNSGAYGLMQFMPNTWGDYGYQKTSDPVKQITAGIDYIKQRYGTPEAAQAFWQKNNWY
jgi:soluble lytic murein transglycosylase-like protein